MALLESRPIEYSARANGAVPEPEVLACGARVAETTGTWREVAAEGGECAGEYEEETTAACAVPTAVLAVAEAGSGSRVLVKLLNEEPQAWQRVAKPDASTPHRAHMTVLIGRGIDGLL